MPFHSSLLGLVETPPMWMVLPFCLLLLCIATLPLLACTFWEHHFKKVSLGLGFCAVAYYAIAHHEVAPVLHTLEDYFGFMALIGSLFIITGGISVRVKGESAPWKNAVFLFVGALMATVVGTTGASMLMIRPWISMNKYRITSYHIVFFIFIISNVGGSLTPAGNPPLYLGFLRGVGFMWTLQNLWPSWLLAVSLLVGVFYVLDVRNFHKAPRPLQEHVEHEHEHWKIHGLVNLVWLAVVLGTMLLPRDLKLGTEVFAIPVSVLVMAAAAVISYTTTPKQVHETNHFSFGPVKEVGWLFIGIFLTMRPALDILQGGNALTISTPLAYFFSSGALSAFLDNAPTYLAFLTAAMGQHHASVDSVADVTQFSAAHGVFVLAVSMGANFFGAGSYIGNGPNFMVKAIADKLHVHTPSFPGYIFKYSLPMLLPVLAFVGWVFLGRSH